MASSEGVLSELQSTLNSIKTLEGPEKASAEWGACIKRIQQLPSRWHIPESDPDSVLSAFWQLLGSMYSIMNRESPTADNISQRDISATVRELLFGVFADTSSNASAPIIQASCACNLFLQAVSETHNPNASTPPTLPLLPRDALLLLFWIDSKLLNPGPGRPSPQAQELLERTPSGVLSVSPSALSLLHDPRAVHLLQDLLLIASPSESPSLDPVMTELYVDVARWAAATAGEALACLLPRGAESKVEQLAALEKRASALLLATLKLEALALGRLAEEHGKETDQKLTPEVMSTLGDTVALLHQLGDAVIETSIQSTAEDASLTKALETAGDVYGAAAAALAVYSRAAGPETASELAAKLRSQVARLAWLGASKSSGSSSGTPKGSVAASGSSPMSHSGTPGSRNSGSVLFQARSAAAVKAWRWNLGTGLHEAREEGEAGVVVLMRSLLECLAQLLAWCWDAGMHDPARHVLLLPDGLPSKMEQQATAVLLGRFFLLTSCDPPLARLILPLLGDSLASGQEHMEPPTNATLLWVLAAMAAATTSHHTHHTQLEGGGEEPSWLMGQVLDLLTHLYRQPTPHVQKTLMGGAPGAAGECRDALAVALEKLASGTDSAPPSVQQEVKRRTLQLFHEVGLRASQGGPTAQWDLGALLPTVAAAFRGSLTPMGPPKGMSVRSQMSIAAVEKLAHSQGVIMQLLKELWFHCAVHKFADPASEWPKHWQQAAGEIAAATPLLLLGTGPNRTQDIIERLRAEMGTVVERAGSEASLSSLHNGLTKLLSPHAARLPCPSHQLSAAFLYTVATAELARASLAPLEALCQSSPLLLPQMYLETAPPGGEDAQWYKALLNRTFSAIVSRLSLLRNDQMKDVPPADKALVEECMEVVAMSLIAALADSGGHAVGAAPVVVDLSRDLLLELLDKFPFLYWSHKCFEALLDELEQEQGDRQLGQLTTSTTATAGLVWQQTKSWMAKASRLAPSRTEALLHTFLGGGAGKAGGAAVQRRGAELLAVCSTARQTSELAGLEAHAEQGVMALSRKQHYLGMVEAMQQNGASKDSTPFSAQLAEQLECVTSSSAAQPQLEHIHLLCAAYLATQNTLPPSHPAITRIVKCLCRAPTERFTRDMVSLSVFVWTWVTSAAPELEQVVLREVAAAWAASAQKQLGIFSGAAAAKQGFEGDDSVVDGIRCHQHWLAFFIELWNASKHSCKPTRAATFQVYGALLHSSLAHPESLSQHPAAVAPRFRLLSLALDYTQERAKQAQPGPCPDAAALLNDRVIMAALHWFMSPPSWHHKCSEREVHERHNALRAFLSRLSPPSQAPLPTLTSHRLRDALRKPGGSFTYASSIGHGRRPAGAKSNGVPTITVTPSTSTATSGDSPPSSNGTMGGPGKPPLAVVNGGGVASRGPHPSPRTSLPGDAAHPVWKNAEHTVKLSEKLQQLVTLLVSSEAERLEVWASPRFAPASPSSSPAFSSLKPQVAASWINTAWGVNPRLALGLMARCPTSAAMRGELENLVAQHCKEASLKLVPEAAMLLATPAAAKANTPQLAELDNWAPASAVDGLELLSSLAGGHPRVKAYAMRCLHTLAAHKLASFLPQLVQSLRHDTDGQVAQLLVNTAKDSNIFAHHLIWALRAESQPPEEAFNPVVKRSGWQPPKDFGLWGPASQLQQTVLAALTSTARQYWDAEGQYFDRINRISGILKELPPDQRRGKINEELEKISLPRSDLYLPPCPDMKVVSAVPGSGTPMPSAAKVPILVAFKVESPSRPVPFVQPLIFKVGDDVRQDVLALQVIQVLKDAFQSAGLDLYLRPYGVLPTGYETGIIEVVPNTKSRSGVGEITEGGLYDYFQIQFGQPGSQRFETARRNFILSEAGYAIASFLLQCKDRHNGNLLIDAEGHLVHIDFGFILEISPGGNLGFESAAFKLSHEMTQLLDPGLARNSAQFKMFEEYCVRGYLVARTVAEPILALVALMEEAGLPCFSRGAPVDNLRKRFHLEMSEAQAAAFMRAAINDSYQKWTTGFYDAIQYLQNAIPR